ncbi:unnamed protein product [Darwinula stevensoni]|uniref:Chitin-binding type-2 domain-containing protein n=1 Tax=Darwinula stevensoni TaxID=69355 RepID=A0A7R9A8T5_9CRUS|nr:unnamed protein product [Darwinula stevensoni]CAG0896712.1 unnamed protein product [Darwinula stevensoni]
MKLLITIFAFSAIVGIGSSKTFHKNLHLQRFTSRVVGPAKDAPVDCPPENDPDGEAILLPNPYDCGSYYVCDWAQNGEFALHLPNPLDCGSFCQCNWGTAIYMPCPAGLHFNAELQVCDWPENAGCDINSRNH